MEHDFNHGKETTTAHSTGSTSRSLLLPAGHCFGPKPSPNVFVGGMLQWHRNDAHASQSRWKVDCVSVLRVPRPVRKGRRRADGIQMRRRIHPMTPYVHNNMSAVEQQNHEDGGTRGAYDVGAAN
ncbi:hypothetical protein B0H10DRAFT_1946677 [Mycena sp. CBHHK59/15]|nr:hypothetical protein B0H10DRAFT_1946677 [Mycena sp. CBHHK59/15]